MVFDLPPAVTPPVTAGAVAAPRGVRPPWEEIFGHVLAVITYEDDEDAVPIANDSPYGLHAHIATGDMARGRAEPWRDASGPAPS
ncbi:aldehyde dehydrogenase family protein [Streptomyces sp. NPDC002690]